MHGIYNTSGRPEYPRLVFTEDVVSRMKFSKRRVTGPSREPATVEAEWNPLGRQSFQQLDPARVHAARDDKVRFGSHRDEWPMPEWVACLRKIMHRKVERVLEALPDVWLLEEDRIIRGQQHQL